MNNDEKKKAVLEMCQDYAAAFATGRPNVINAVAVDIEGVRLPALFPDAPAQDPSLTQVATKSRGRRRVA